MAEHKHPNYMAIFWALAVLTVAMTLGTRLPAIGAGAIALGLFGLSWFSGVLGAVAVVFDADSLRPATDLLRTLDQRQADVLAVSATMTFHVRAVADLIAAVRSEHGDAVKVLVGGYPFNVDPDLWRRIGADGSAPDALESVALAGRLAGGG